jgi:hypothetical protein
MVDPRRLDSDPAADGSDAGDREGRTEALLVEGLDRYFAGRYEDAIHLWTRVLFLDRNHARARAYIDRARTALAERQRQSDEMLQTSRTLLEQGETQAARDLLTEAVAQSGEDEHAAALRIRLERVERLQGPDRPDATDIGGAADQAAPAVPGWSWPARPRPVVLGLVLAAGLLLVFSVTAGLLQDWLAGRPAPQGLRPATGAVRIPVLTSGEVALVRARTLASRGRLAEALRALEHVSPDSAQRAAVDRLRADLQQLLLAGGQEPAGAARR